MTFILKKASRFFIRSLLTAAALLFIALITIQVALIAGINILATGKGSDFIAAQINGQLAESGYNVDFDSLYYDPVRGFTLYGLSVSDDQGEFLTIDRFSLAVSLALSPARILRLHAQGGTLSLSRIPTSKEDSGQDAQASLSPFEIPDIYFRTVDLSRLSFDHVLLAPSVAGSAYDFSPSLRARVTLNDKVGLALNLQPGMPALTQGLDAPEEVIVNGTVTPQTLDFSLSDVSIESPSYVLNINGSGNLSQNGILDLKAQARHDKLAPLTEELFEKASATMSVTGTSARPILDVSAAVITKKLKERGLSNIDITLKTEEISAGIAGQARIETAFQNQPVILESKLSYEDVLLHLMDLKGEAPGIALSGGGTFSTQNHLFDGRLNILAQDLARYSDLAGFKIAGRLKADATFTTSEELQQSADISTSITDGVFDSIKVRSLSAQASFDSLATPWPKMGKLESSGLYLSDSITIDNINAVITQSQDQMYKLSLNGSGHTPSAFSFNGSTMLSGLTQPLPTAQNISLEIKSGGSSALLSGDFTPDHVDLAVKARGFKGKDLPTSLPNGLADLRIDLDATTKGTPSDPHSNLTATLNGIGSGTYKGASLSVDAAHDGEKIVADLSGNGSGIRKLDATTSFPMTLSLYPFNFTLSDGAPLEGKITADIDIAAVSPLFLPPTQELSGQLTADGTIKGTIGSPSPTATVRLNNVNFDDMQNNIVIADLKATANISPELLSVTSLTATDGKAGTLQGGGSLSFGNDSANVGVKLKNFNIPQGNLANGIINTDLFLKGSDQGMQLSGKAEISEMNILIPETFSSRIPQLNIVEDVKDTGPGFLQRLILDIAVSAKNQVFVRGWGLDAEFGGDVAISGTADGPQFNGALSSRRGRYEEFGKRFTLARADLRFQGDVPPSPYLDIEATTPAGDVTGSVLLTGPVQSPSIKFSSSPALPEDEVLSRILFGKDSSKISPFQAVQLAQTIRRFSGQGGGTDVDPLGMIRSATGLDDISVETDESGAANVEAGKYLTDNVYLELSKGKGENSGAATIKIEVTPSINIESEIGQDAQGGGGILWKHDY